MTKQIMLPSKEREAIIDLIHRQVVPAIGCTEPMAVALCVAKAAEILGKRPERIDLSLSGNILKNAMGVGIPGTGMIGLPIAIALGAIIGKSEYMLEVLRECTPEAVERGKEYIAEDRIHIAYEKEDPDKLYIKVCCYADNHESEAVIRTTHTNFIYLRRDQEVLLDNTRLKTETAASENALQLTMRKVYDFATTSPVEELDFILEAKRLNEAVSEEGLKGNFGHRIGKTVSSAIGRGVMGDGIMAKVISKTGAACDARMAGAMLPVMSNSGSGNQGICATMPVVVFAAENNNSEEELIRALILSNLTAIYIKQSLGPLSALCGCVVAGTGSSVGITYLMGGNYDQVTYTVKNMVANLTGMICDGAKPSCAFKISTGVGTGVMSAMMAMQQRYVTSVEGIIDDDVDRCIRNLTTIGKDGMNETDRRVLEIMTDKTK